MSFLNPAMLGALALVGIPVLIHLLRKKRVVVVRWAAMEFLRLSQERQKRRLRVEELILLLLRCLIVLSVVMAFARPVLRSLGFPIPGVNARVYAVIVVDNSFSMGLKGADGKTSLQRAQTAAQEIFTKVLKPGDAVSLVFLSNKPEEAIGAASYDLGAALKRVQSAKVGSRATDYLETAKTVSRLLKASKIPAKEVYWLSDDQAGAWETSRRDSAKSFWKEFGTLARLTWVSVGAEAKERNNLAVEQPILANQLVTPQLSARLEAQIDNYSDKSYNALLVNLIVEGKRVGTTQVNLPPNGSATARFLYRFAQPRTYTGKIELQNADDIDRLTADNSAPFAVPVREQLKVLVIDPHPSPDPAHNESFYLITAMAPSAESESIAPTLRTEDSLVGVALRDYAAIVYTNPSRISESDSALLAEYVKAGGGLLLFPSSASSPNALNASLASGGLLPAAMGTRKSLSDTEAVSLNPASINSLILAPFKDTATMDIGGARFTAYFPLELSAEADMNAIQVLMKMSNGDPAFVERRVGQGRVILSAISAGADGSQLPLRSSYVPLIYQLTSYLGMGASSQRNLKQDETLTLKLPVADSGKPVQITLPDGTVTSQNSVLDAQGVAFQFKNTGQAGIYGVQVQNGKTKDGFAVGLPPQESNLAYAEPAQTATQAGVPANNLNVITNSARIAASVQRSRFGVELWRPLLWLILPLMLLESFLAQRFGRRS